MLLCDTGYWCVNVLNPLPHPIRFLTWHKAISAALKPNIRDSTGSFNICITYKWSYVRVDWVFFQPIFVEQVLRQKSAYNCAPNISSNTSSRFGRISASRVTLQQATSWTLSQQMESVAEQLQKYNSVTSCPLISQSHGCRRAKIKQDRKWGSSVKWRIHEGYGYFIFARKKKKCKSAPLVLKLTLDTKIKKERKQL